jgi:hypothetical protein
MHGEKLTHLPNGCEAVQGMQFVLIVHGSRPTISGPTYTTGLRMSQLSSASGVMAKHLKVNIAATHTTHTA